MVEPFGSMRVRTLTWALLDTDKPVEAHRVFLNELSHHMLATSCNDLELQEKHLFWMIGGTLAVGKRLTLNGDDEVVVTNGLFCLANAAYNHNGLKESIVEMNGFGIIAKGMEDHSDNVEIQKAGLMCFHNFAIRRRQQYRPLQRPFCYEGQWHTYVSSDLHFHEHQLQRRRVVVFSSLRRGTQPLKQWSIPTPYLHSTTVQQQRWHELNDSSR